MDANRIIAVIESMQPNDREMLLRYLKQGAAQGFGDTAALYFGGKSDLYISVESDRLTDCQKTQFNG